LLGWLAGISMATARASGAEPDIGDGLVAAIADVRGPKAPTFNMAAFRTTAIARRDPLTGLTTPAVRSSGSHHHTNAAVSS